MLDQAEECIPVPEAGATPDREGDCTLVLVAVCTPVPAEDFTLDRGVGFIPAPEEASTLDREGVSILVPEGVSILVPEEVSTLDRAIILTCPIGRPQKNSSITC